jgi:hypothetical protein
MASIPELLGMLAEENPSEEDIEKLYNADLENLSIPSSISVENTLAEINAITKRLYELHNKQKRDPIPLNKLVSLLELKTKIMGMMNIKPDMQNIIDSEINTYKRRFLELAKLAMDKITLDTLCEKLTREGL